MQILIVEDEPMELQLIESMLLMHGQSNILKAENGLQALSLIEEYTINLVFLDIQIPGITGMELLRKIKEQQKEIVVSIVSAYDYFTYAQQAIELGVSAYLLKPFSDQEFTNVLKKMESQYLEKMNQQDVLIQSSIERSIFSNIELDAVNKYVKFEPDTVFVLSSKDDSWRNKLSAAINTQKAMLVPQPINGFYLIITTKNEITFFRQLLLSISLASPSEIFFGVGVHKNVTVAFEKAVVHFNEQEMPIFSKFMEYLKSNFHKNIMLSDVARQVHMSASNLNRLLKREYGKTFKDILIDIRIEKSKELLQRNYSIEMVSDMVGFNSAAYFTVCFKKFTGYTPSKYRAYEDDLTWQQKY